MRRSEFHDARTAVRSGIAELRAPRAAQEFEIGGTRSGQD